MNHLRQYLHAQPEVSGYEEQTSAFVVAHLRQLGIRTIHQGFSMHSVLAEIEGKEAGNTILVRCELDALPIQELNTFEHRSTVKGVSHKCGHDGHIAILLSLAEKLVNNPLPKGKVVLFFQSAEETGAGAKAAIESGIFNDYSIDYAVSLHNLPQFPLGSIILKKGIFTPTVESLNLQWRGKTSHAAEPSQGINPANAIARLVQFIRQLHNDDKSSPSYFVTTPIFIKMGEVAYGTSAGYAEVGYTFRTWESAKFDSFKELIENEIASISEEEQLGFEIEWVESFKSNNNRSGVIDELREIALIRHLEVIEREKPFDFGEDFGLFTDTFRGAMFGIGSGENCCPLHNEHYDFPDELIPIGCQVFYDFVQRNT